MSITKFGQIHTGISAITTLAYDFYSISHSEFLKVSVQHLFRAVGRIPCKFDSLPGRNLVRIPTQNLGTLSDAYDVRPKNFKLNG